MATSIGQYAPVFLPGEHPWQRGLAGHSLQGHRVGHDQRNPADIDVSQWELGVKAVQLLGLQGPWWCQVCRDTDCLCPRSYSPIWVFFRASCSWQSESLFGQSFSVAPPIQALRGLPYLGSFSFVRQFRHLRGTLGGVLLWSLVPQAFDGPASLLFSCQCWCVGGERLWWWFHPLHVTQQYLLASMTSWLSSTGISYHNLLPHIPSIRLSTVNSSPPPGTGPQSLNSSSQLLHLPGDRHPCPGCVWRRQGLSVSHSI